MTDLEVRPAMQQRSRDSWIRILDAGVEVLAEGGGDGFTIAAVCDRAGVTPPTIYRRAPNKDALFLAVYEHGITRIQDTEQTAALAATLPAGADPTATVEHAVGAVASIFLAHRDFLRAVIIISATNHVIRSRGVDASHALGAVFDLLTETVMTPDLTQLRSSLFQMLFGALVLRTGFGPDFASPEPFSDDEFVGQLQAVAARAMVKQP